MPHKKKARLVGRAPKPPQLLSVVGDGGSRNTSEIIAEATGALATMAVALEQAATARQRLAGLLARLAHPTPPLREITGGRGADEQLGRRDPAAASVTTMGGRNER